MAEKELSFLRDQLQQRDYELSTLKAECERLKLEQEITGIERQLGSLQTQSTPKVRFEDTNTSSPYSGRRRLLPPTPTSPISRGTPDYRSPGEYIITRKNKGRDDGMMVETPSKRTVMMKPATYDGSVSWRDYKAHYYVCAAINNWSYSEKGLYLAVS